MKPWRRRFSIQQKLFFTLSVGFTGFMVYFTANLYITRNNQTVMNTLVEERLPLIADVEELSRAFGAVKNLVVQSAFSGSMEAIANVDSVNERVLNAFKKLQNAKTKIPQVAEAEQKYQKAFKACSETLQNITVGIEQVAAAQPKMAAYAAEFSNLEKWSLELQELQNQELREAVDSANAGSQRALYLGWLLILAAPVFAGFFYVITRNSIKAIQSVNTQLSRVSENIYKISSEASSSSSRLASSSTQQATSVSESVSSMEEMKSKLGHTLRNSSEALLSSEESHREAGEGKLVVDNLKAAMVEIELSYVRLEELNQVVRMIREKTQVINDIVFKTQLLSFNASIEAARAGQHGRGFSVVAAEVGKLAETSGRAAQEIGKLLDQSSKQVADVVSSTRTKMGSAQQMSMNCAEVLERITERTRQVKGMVNAITEAASDQEQSIHVVVRAMNDMRDGASQTDKMAHTIAQVSDVLRGHSQALESTVRELATQVHGSTDTENKPPPPNKPQIEGMNEILRRRSA